MRKSDPSIYLFLFLLLLSINAVLRFYEVGVFSLSNDELSAVIRLNHPNFQSLISEGVILTDPHPAGVQVFLYYWTSLFGNSVFALRFPFVIAGILGLVFMYLTIKTWFGSQSALLSTALFSLSAFSIIQGQLARPYAMGIFFVMLFAWSWTKVLFGKEKKFMPKILFVFAGVLAAYTHYYAALLIGIIGIGGLHAAHRNAQLKQYLVLGGLIVLMFLPHLSITLAQLSRGSITSWIPLAEGSFFVNHINTLLNGSYALWFVAGLGLIVTVIQITRAYGNKFQLFALWFFLLPIILGFVYSHFLGSALMDRVLYFSAPFFFAFLFSAIPTLKNGVFATVFGLLCLLTIASTIVEEKLPERNYVEHFKELSIELDSLRNNTEDEPLMVGSFNAPEYINYYLEPKATFAIASLDSDRKLARYMKAVREFDGKSLSLFWACSLHPIAANEYARRHFPSLSSQGLYYNSAFWNYEKKPVLRDTVRYLRIEGDSILGPDQIYVDLLKISASEVHSQEVMNVHLNFVGEDVTGCMLVFSQSDSQGNLLDWNGYKFSDFVLSTGENELFSSFRFPKQFKSNDVFSVYIWNSESKNLRLKPIEIYSFKDTNFDYLY